MKSLMGIQTYGVLNFMICLTDFSLTEVNGLNLSNFNWLQRRDTYQKRISEFTKMSFRQQVNCKEKKQAQN